MDPRTRDMLNQIDEFLSRSDSASAELWQVLSALRGPDENMPSIKHAMTEPIRTAAFPKTAQVFLYGGWAVPAFFAEPGTSFLHLYEGGAHFRNHAQRAAILLGIA